MLHGTGVKEKKKEKKSNDIQIHIYVHTQNHANVPLKTYFDGDSLWEFKSHAAALYLPLNRSPIVKQHTCVLISKFHISHSID